MAATLARWRDMFAPFEAAGGWLPFVAPAIRIEQLVEDGRYVVRAEIPGVDPKKDIDIAIENRVMRISAERKAATKAKAHSEFHYGKMLRTVALPVTAKEDTARATYGNGVLEISFTLGEAQNAARHVAIEADKVTVKGAARETGPKAAK